MAKYHINPESGSPKLCTAKSGNCPFGSDNDHYASVGEARFAAELKLSQEHDNFLVASRKKPYSPKSIDEKQTAALFESEITSNDDIITFPDYGTKEETPIALSAMKQGVYCINNCQQASVAIVEYLENSETKAELMGVEFNDGSAHIAVRSVNASGTPVIVDYTARQFGLDLPYPLVLEEAKWEKLINERVQKIHGLSIQD